jgi:TP901 family phage tail tape measure protein
MTNFEYKFTVSGNYVPAVDEMNDRTNKFKASLDGATAKVASFCKQCATIELASGYFERLESNIQGILAPGAELESQLAELEAIAGVTEEQYYALEKAARDTAKEFGISAAGSVNSYKLLLSQLSPELAKNSEALNNMGKNVAVLSKMMGNDATSAAEVLTTAMNQFGVSLDDPMAASDRMWEMMNTMAAAAREGSAELPAIKVALQQCGMAAKAAGVSFEETNAAIQVLDKAGKKGSEGGVALRNVMSTLAQGRFLPKDVREELSAAGIQVSDLTDKSKSLAERLEVLKPVMADDALFSKLFGKENSAAAMALVQGIPKVEQWTKAITGTTTAIDQSQIVMATYTERVARVKAKIDDMKISVFNVCGDFGIWVTLIAQSLIPLSQLVPLLQALGNMIGFVRAMNFKKIFTGVSKKIRGICLDLVLLDASLAMNGGFWVTFKAIATGACRSVSTAIMSIPIIGWIAAGITAVIAVVEMLWEKCKGFRVFVFTTWEAIKAIFNAAWIIVKSVGEQIVGYFQWVFECYSQVWNFIVEISSRVWNAVWGTVKGAIEKIVAIAESLWEKITTFAESIGEAFRSIADTLRGWFDAVCAFVISLPERISSAFEWLWGKIVSGIEAVKGAVMRIAEGIRSFFGKICDTVEAVVSAVVERAVAIWDGFKSIGETVVAFINSAVENVRGFIDSVINSIVGVVNGIISKITAIWERIKQMASQVGAIFAGIMAKIRGFVNSVKAHVVSVVNAVVVKVKGIAQPLINVFNKVATSVKNVFNKVLGWVQEKIDSVLQWFIDLYNKVAAALGWDKIVAKGRASADRSWAKDHPQTEKNNVDAAAGANAPGAESTTTESETSASGSGSSGGSISSGLSGIGGSADKSDRIKNINITIDKLVDNLTISTTTLQESAERIKEVVAEALLGAVNDANYTLAN